jgi:peptidyl-tRNA hydrolase
MADPSSNSGSVAASAVESPPQPSDSSDVLVQYVVMRGDLIKAHKWNVGGLIANGSHACVAVICEHMADAEVKAYIDPTAATQMHKVVLAAKDDAELGATSDLLTHHQMKHKVWTEQPENFRSCLAVRPYPRSLIQPLLKHLKLFR